MKLDEVFDALFQNRFRVSQCRHIVSETASMFVRQGDDSRNWEECLRNFELLQRMDCKFRLPPNHFWKPSDGLLETHELLKMYTMADNASQITEYHSKQHQEPSMTIPFHAMMKIRIELEHEHMSAWVCPDVSPQELIHQFDGQMKLIECTSDNRGFAFVLRHMKQVQDLDAPDGFVMPCLQQGTILFMKLDTKNHVPNQLNEFLLEHVQYDQIGILSAGQKNYEETMLLDQRLAYAPLEHKVCFVMAAYHNTQMSYLTDVSKMCTVFTIQGDEDSRKIMASMWASVIHHDTLKYLKVKVRVTHMPDCSKVVFEQTHPIPASAFSVMLTVLATRRLMDALAEPTGKRAVFKWRTKAIWDGPLNTSINMTTIAAICQITFFPVMLGRKMRFIHMAKQCCDVTVEQLWNDAKNNFLMFQMVEECTGGTGNKDSQKMWVRNSLAATLLEQGYDMEWVASTTDTLLTKAGMKTMMQIARMPPGKQRLDALLKMCEDCSMTPPTKIVQAANRATQKDIQNPRKKFAVYIDPSQYQIQPNFFLTQNDDPAQQIYEIRNEGSGFIMLTLDAALPWIREIGK